MQVPPSRNTTQEDWIRVENFQNSFLIKPDETLDKILASSDANGVPAIAVSVAQGKFLHLLVRSLKAKRVLEVGTLAGYSTTWFARGLPDDGEVVTLEINEKFAKLAQENFKNAGVASKVKLIVAPALDSLKKMPSEQKFDLVFIDADKQNSLNYFTEAKRLVKSGGVIIVDNAIREGGVADLNDTDEKMVGMRNLLASLKTDPDVEGTTIATVGEKGYDGFMYSVRK